MTPFAHEKPNETWKPFSLLKLGLEAELSGCAICVDWVFKLLRNFPNF